MAVENEQGCKDTSDVYKVNSVSIGSIATGGSILIYPNPANNMVHISGVEPAHITISTIEGRVIKTYNKTNRFSVEGLSSGAYLLKITDANNNVIHIEKLIKSE